MDEATMRLVQCGGCDTPLVCAQKGCCKSLREYAQSRPICKCPDVSCLRHNSFAENNVRSIGND
jgi:hypothetical protein